MKTLLQKLRRGAVLSRPSTAAPGSPVSPASATCPGIIPIDADGWWSPRSLPIASLHEAARRFNERGGVTLVEIGSGLHGDLAGNSIQVWLERTCARRIVAVDTDPERIREVRELSAGRARVETVVADGIDYLRRFAGSIDLLYLDFWLPDPEGAVPGTGRAQGYLRAYQAARSRMSERALILIDDTDHIHPWKHTHLVPEARADGFRVVYIGRQTLLAR